MGRCGADDTGLHIGRHRDVEHLDLWISEHVFQAGMAARYAVQLGDFFRLGRIARGDGHRIEAGLPVGDQVTIADDEAGPDAADPPIAAARQAGKVIEGEVEGGSSHGKVTCADRGAA